MGLNRNLGKLTEILTISGSSIGVGITSPSQKLDVSGSIKANNLITGLTSYDTNGLTVRNAANTSNLWSINKGAGDGSENWQFYNFGRNSIDFSLNDSTGYVGIGTTNPLSMLHSKSSGYPTLTLEGGTSNGAGIRFFGGTTQFAEIFGEYQSSGNGQLFFRTRNSNTISTAMTILGNGNVGIGNTSPIRRLEVTSDGSNWISGTFSGTGSTNKVVVGNLVTPTIGGHNSSLGAWTDFTIAGDNILFSPFGTEKMRLRSDGSLANNGVKTQYASGYSDISTTFYVDFPAYPSTPYKIVAALTHWIGAYGAYREMVEFNNAYTDLSYIDILNHSSTAGGSWSISRPDNATLRVTHNGGNYAAYGNWWIQVIGN